MVVLPLVMVLGLALSASAATGDLLFWFNPYVNGGNYDGIQSATDVQIAHNGDIYVLDYYGLVAVYDRNGLIIRKWGSYGSAEGQFIYPKGMARMCPIMIITES